MAVRKMKAFKALALFLVFGFGQVFVQTSLGSPGGAPPQARLISARVTSTRGNLPILINGSNSSAGTTVLTGAVIETGDQAGGTIEISPLGFLDIEPNSKVQLDFSDSGFRVNVFRGCVKVRARGNETAEVYTAEGASEKTNSNRRGIGVCFLNGQLTQASTQAAVTGGGLTGAQIAAIVGAAAGTTTLLIIALGDGTGRGANPSP